jgi:hypothetical protein
MFDLLEEDLFILTYLNEAWQTLMKMRKTRTISQTDSNLVQFPMEAEGVPALHGQRESKEVSDKAERRLKAILKTELQSCDLMESSNSRDANNKPQTLSFYLTLLKTDGNTVPQDPHIDFKWTSVDEELMSVVRHCKNKKYNHVVPLIALFPLTKEGMIIEIWPDEPVTGDKVGQLVQIQYGTILILRGDVVHAGGFCSGPQGNPRAHMYLYRDPGKSHDHPTSNLFHDQLGVPLRDTYLHCNQVAALDEHGVLTGALLAPEALEEHGVVTGALLAASAGDTDHMPTCLACTLPQGEAVSYHYDCSSRVLLLDFTLVDSLTVQNKQCIGKLYEQPDYTVVCKGLLPSCENIEDVLKGRKGLQGFGNAPHYKFRLYKKKNNNPYRI